MIGASRAVSALEEHDADLQARESDVPGVGSPTCTPATVEGGSKTNVVPGSCRVTVVRLVTPDEDIEAAEAEFRDVISRVVLPAGVCADVDVVLRALPFRSDRGGVQVQALHRNAEAIRGTDVPIRGSRGFSDARFFTHGGAKTEKYGPGNEESNIHGADENVEIEQVRDAGGAPGGQYRRHRGRGVVADEKYSRCGGFTVR